MNGQNAAGSVFMCRLCNLFSPSRSQLVDHCSQQHPEQAHLDDIIIALQPLQAELKENLTGKRKRGRPKGSTKKLHRDLLERKPASSQSPEHEGQKEQMNDEGDQHCDTNNGDTHDGKLECRNCHRSFCNRRQILKHICISEEDHEEEDVHSYEETGGEASENLHPGGEQNQIKLSQKRPKDPTEKDAKNFKASRSKRGSKVENLNTENKKRVISVVLTEDETFPGDFLKRISKIVPLVDGSVQRESEPQAQNGDFQTKSQDGTSGAMEASPETGLETRSETTSAQTSATGNSKGFQEYSIKQDATNLLQRQLKIFACEFCNKIFKFRHTLVDHLRIHTQEKPFQCPHCDYASAIKANLNVHVRKHTGEKFTCPHCPFNCLSQGHLKVHIERVHMKVKQHCSFCEKKYSDVKNLLKHMEKRHNLEDPAVQQSYQQLRLKTRQGLRQLLYHCPTCNRRFKNQLERERHLLVHGPQRPFACVLCDHAATKMSALTAHVRRHIFIYLCCRCDEKFVSSQRLKKHLKECHPELDQEQAFTGSINSSFYLIQPGRGLWESEEGERADRGGLQVEGVALGGEGAQGGGKEGVMLTGTVDQQWAESQEEEVHAQEEEKETDELKTSDKLNSQESPDDCPSATESTAAEGANKDGAHTCLTPESTQTPPLQDKTLANTNTTPGNTSAFLAPSTAAKTKGSQLVHQNAFQEVFSSLKKTQLSMEIFQRLRKIYGELECQYCGKLFWYKVHYNVHVRTHTKEHSHYCSKCSYSSITKSSLKRHQLQKHSGLSLACSKTGCKYTTSDKYKLQAHLKTHQEKGKAVSCPVCKQSLSEHRLKSHIKTSHPDAPAARGKGMMVQRAEMCPYCDSYFLKNSSDFQQHIWAHQGVKPYTCSMCDYASRSRSNLKTHMNRHNTDRPHLCDLCGKKFKSKGTLKSHRLSHTDKGKQFQCSVCDYTSGSRPSLLRHMEQHCEFKPFQCAHCQYSCNNAAALKRHYNLKHPDQTYEDVKPGLPDADAVKQQGGMICPECDCVYRTKWELNRHLKSKHSLKIVDGHFEAGQETEAQYVSVENEEHQTEAPLMDPQDSGDIEHVTETQDAVTSMVTMAPGTVTVVQQLQVGEEQEGANCNNQLMVLQADGSLDGNQVMVVEETHGLEALTVLTQGDNTHHYIVYVQEHTVEIN
ncbi:zinc finger protein ZFAT isoform X2 [Gouania willdenowi]|uniref:zinc finger protein ZFAT isoform X2 n=1 Tax=Gouania willdenowi TaxID=441366 RepID=UPI0010556F26|nr:zinc finger protein ZFAT isoform X2 [Gouania willdenowi]